MTTLHAPKGIPDPKKLVTFTVTIFDPETAEFIKASALKDPVAAVFPVILLPEVIGPFVIVSPSVFESAETAAVVINVLLEPVPPPPDPPGVARVPEIVVFAAPPPPPP